MRLVMLDLNGIIEPVYFLLTSIAFIILSEFTIQKKNHRDNLFTILLFCFNLLLYYYLLT